MRQREGKREEGERARQTKGRDKRIETEINRDRQMEIEAHTQWQMQRGLFCATFKLQSNHLKK